MQQRIWNNAILPPVQSIAAMEILQEETLPLPVYAFRQAGSSLNKKLLGLAFFSLCSVAAGWRKGRTAVYQGLAFGLTHAELLIGL